MSLGGLFGGSGGALRNQKATIQRSRDQAVNNVQKGTDQLKYYLGDKARQEIIDAQSHARDVLNQGVNQASPYLQKTADLYSGLAPGDMSARAMYLNTLGLNGSKGNQAAVDAFRVSPGYQWKLDQGLQADLRNGAATGNVASGNVLQALQDRGMNLADQEYGGWQDRLMNQGNNIYQDYAGQGNALSKLADLFSGQGRDLANIDTWGGGARAGLYGTIGQGVNNNFNTIANIDWNRGQSLSNLAQANQAQQAAQQQSLWGGLLGLGGNLLGAAGKAGSIGTLFG